MDRIKSKIIRLLMVLLTITFNPMWSVSQPDIFFVKHGNNLTQVSCGSTIFAPVTDLYHTATGAGAVWVRQAIDLRQSFDIIFLADFNDTLAVDGAAFVLAQDTTKWGDSYNGLGFRNLSPSVGVTFDAKMNTADNDPPFDHLSIQANGNTNHSSAGNLAGPLSIESLYTIISRPGEPDVKLFHHLVNVRWNPLTFLLAVYIDGKLFLSTFCDMLNKIFNGNPTVYWGFTASNTQLVQYPPAAETYFGRFIFFYGTDVVPHYSTIPAQDSCYSGPIRFYDQSVYTLDSIFNGLLNSKWYWDFGDGTHSTFRNPPPHNYPGPGTYTVKFTVTNQVGCSIDTFITKVNLGAKPVPSFGSSIACTKKPVLFFDSSRVVGNTAIVSWLWDFGNGKTSSDSNPRASFGATGNYHVHLSVRSSYGCEADTFKTITVNETPDIRFTFSENCDGVVDYKAEVINNVDIDKWQWDFGDNNNSGIQNPQHLFGRNGIYNTILNAVAASGCISDTIVGPVKIDKVYPYAGADTIIAAGQPLQLHGSGGTSFQWKPSSGLNNPLIADPVAVLTSNQTYILTVKNDEGCSRNDTLNIKVFSNIDVYVPNAFTPNNDGKNDVFRIIAPGITRVDYFRIYNRWGRLVYQANNLQKGWNGQIGNTIVENGTYVWAVRAIDYKGNIIEKKGTVLLIR